MQGLEKAQSQFDQSTRRLSAGASSDSTDSVDLGGEIVAMLAARNAFEVNLKLAHTANQMERRTIDILA